MTDPFHLIEALLWEPSNGYFLLERHLERLRLSALHFNFPCETDAVREQLFLHAQRLPQEPRKVRLFLSADGGVDIKDENVKTSEPIAAALATDPVDNGDVFLRHKTTRRAVYDRALGKHPEAQDVLLFNERRELTETCYGNLVLEIEGRKLTPPLSCGLLPGVFRARLLDRGEIAEEILPVDAIETASELFLINSVRKWRKLKLLPR